MSIFVRATGLINRITKSDNYGSLFVRVVLGLAGFGFGLWGWTTHTPPSDLTGWATNTFRTMQLITLQFPTSLEAGIPWQLQAARIIMPIVIGWATLSILFAKLTQPLRLANLRNSKDHIIVCGAEQMTSAALQSLAGRRREIVIVAPAFDPARRETLEGLGMTIFIGDPTQAATFTALNLKAAAALFCKRLAEGV